jgi:hypothetical protein
MKFLIAYLIIVGVCFMHCSTAGPQAAVQPNPTEARAKELWELAIEAKGGPNRLHEVQNLLRARGKDHRTIELFVYPNKYWFWADDRPSPLGLSVGLADLDWGVAREYNTKVQGEMVHSDEQKQVHLRAGRYQLLKCQLMLLMETAWVQPIPYAAGEEVFNGNLLDVVYARAGEWKVSYLLDRATHLPVAFRRHLSTGSPGPSGGVGKSANEYLATTEFSDYSQVGGIWLPLRIKYDPKTPFIEHSYAINVEYDQTLFDRPPSIEAGPDAWRPKRKPQN